MAEVGHNSLAGQQKKDTNAEALAVLRIAVGLFFVVFGQYKISAPDLCAPAFATMSKDPFATEPTPSWYLFCGGFWLM